MTKHIRNSEGFTLMEIIIAIGIMALSATIALANIVDWLPDYRLKATARELASGLQQARFEAVRQNANCAITFNVPIGGITYDYVVYLDSSTDPPNWEHDAGETVLAKARLADRQGISLGSDGVTFYNNSSGNPSMAFNRRGLPLAKDGHIGNGSVHLQNDEGDTKKVVVTSAGNIRIE